MAKPLPLWCKLVGHLHLELLRFLYGIGLLYEQPSAMSRSPKSKWHDGQRRINEAGKYIRENTAF